MRRAFYLVVLILCAAPVFASQINRITLADLQNRADLIVMAQVTRVVADGDLDHVTIVVDHFLKGASEESELTLTLVTRGGLKDFDPSLEAGNTGVFFLKESAENGQVEKAYWGSVAIFGEHHFAVTERTDAKAGSTFVSMLEAWRSYRIEHNMVRAVEKYESGFNKGFTGPAGLVDGSADFNLGHSDGMLAKMGRNPENL